jgi:histidine ammonia-lyase
MHASLRWVESALVVHGDDPVGHLEPIYSITTGFGSLAGRQAFQQPALASELSRRLIISNASGVGRWLDPDVVRAAMLVRIASLARGHSGVRPVLVQTLADMLNADVLPAIPEFGSLGASGDLIPLAHLAIVATRPTGDVDPEEESGEAWLDGCIVSGLAAMQAAGIERVVLGPKEGLALVNGTSFSTALAALALHDADRLVRTAEVTAAMTIEALTGFGDAFVQQLHEARGHEGQIAAAAHLRALLAGSEFVDGGETSDPTRQPPQDAYSLRWLPQVHGPVRETLAFGRGIVEREINAATDNPLIFPDLPSTRRLKAVSGGNFHAEYLAFVSDFTAIVTTEIGNIAERRLFRLDDGTLNRGLPDMLVASEHVGIDCGYMLPQYLAAALVSDCKTLSHPDSVDSIPTPTCANQEDHVSMANNAGRHARQVVGNIETVVGIQLVMAAQALELRLQVSGKGPGSLAPERVRYSNWSAPRPPATVAASTTSPATSSCTRASAPRPSSSAPAPSWTLSPSTCAGTSPPEAGPSGRDHPHRHGAPAAQRVVQVVPRLSDELDPRDALGQLGEQDVHLQPGDGLADALVDPHAEGEVSTGVPGDTVLVGVVAPPPRIAVRRSHMKRTILVSSGSARPWKSMSRPVVRKKDWNGESYRKASSTANFVRAGFECRRAHWSGFAARHWTALPMAKTVVSTPADSSARTSRVASSGVMVPLSAYPQICAPSPSGVRFSRAQLVMTQSMVRSPSAKKASYRASSGPNWLKFIAPCASRFSSRPSRGMPTASPKTSIGNSWAISVTASNSRCRTSSSTSRSATTSNWARRLRTLRGEMTPAMAVRSGVCTGGSESRMPCGRQDGWWWKFRGPTPAPEMKVSWSSRISRQGANRVKAWTAYFSSHTTGPASRIRSNSG